MIFRYNIKLEEFNECIRDNVKELYKYTKDKIKLVRRDCGMAYVYRFKDNNNEIIYIGKTVDINRRMSEHFGSRGHLSKDCYKSVSKIEYQKYKTESDALIMETYYITKYNPRYNKLNKSRDTPVIEFEEGTWKLYRELKPTKVIRYKTSILWKVIAFIYLIFAMCYIMGIK